MEILNDLINEPNYEDLLPQFTRFYSYQSIKRGLKENRKILLPYTNKQLLNSKDGNSADTQSLKLRLFIHSNDFELNESEKA